jgi:hypothetical protein
LDGGRGLNLARKEEEQEEEMLLFSHLLCPYASSYVGAVFLPFFWLLLVAANRKKECHR